MPNLAIEMTKDTNQRLERLQQRTGACSQVEVIRRALAVYDYLWQEMDTGGKVIIDREDEQREVVIL